MDANSPGKNTGVGSHSLLQGIFANSGMKPGSSALSADSLPSEPPGKPKLEAIAPITTDCDWLGDRAFKEVIKLK